MNEPVRAADLVGDVLARDPSLIAVFERHSPHFSKLRNPVLRKTMARLVSVEQAAGIAGIPSATLLRDLNLTLGIDTAESQDVQENASPTPALKQRPKLPEVVLDVRDDIRTGKEPFSRIVAAIGSLAEREMLCLRAIFEPAPLYAVLAKRGFTHQTERRADEDWVVWLWRDADASEPAPPASAALPDVSPPADPRETWLDVRGLEPPEPMVRTLTALESLPAGHTLVQVNARVPQFLLPILAERDFQCEIDESTPGRVLVRIRRR